MKRKFLPILLLVLIATLVFAFVSCGKTTSEGSSSGTATESTATETEETEHVLTYVEAVAPTCTTAGNVAYWYCAACNAYYADEEEEEVLESVVLAATGHTAVTDEGTEATCTETGLTEGSHCSVCSAVLVQQEVLPALGHEYEITISKESTCTETGSAHYVCTRCGEETDKVLSARGHTLVSDKNGYSATCTENGLTSSYSCSVCGETIVEQETIEAYGHKVVTDAAVSPTCTETGLTAGKHCILCGENLVEQEVLSALGHDLTHVEHVAATCTTDGNYEYYYCERCEEYFMEINNYTPFSSQSETVIPAFGHTAGEEVKENETEATCTADGGYDVVCHCAVCGEEISRETVVVSAFGHTEATRTDGYEPTCETEGKTNSVYCSVCGETLVEQEIIPALGHTEETVVENATDAVCTEGGSYDIVTYCTVCGEEISRETVTVPALGHTETVVKENEVEPTCTESGKYDNVTYCSVCGEELSRETVTVSALGHTMTYHESTEATCTEDGNVGYYSCSVCGKSFLDEEGEEETTRENTVVSKLGHSLTYYERAEATCISQGNEEYSYCERCGKYFDGDGEELSYEEDILIEKTAHTFGTLTEKTDATCTTDGNYAYYICSSCGYYYDESGEYLGEDENAVTIEAKGHVYSEFVASVDATCTASGMKSFCVCSGCQNKFVLIGGEYVEVTDEDLIVEAKGHTYSDFTEATEATCTENGNAAYCTCTVCGAYFNEDYEEITVGEIEISATGHNFVDGVCCVCGELQGSLIVTTTDGTYSYQNTDGYEIYTVTAAGSYTVSGDATQAQIYVNAGDDDKVYLYLNGVTIENAYDSVVYVNNADTVYLVAVSDTTNVLSDARTASGTYTGTGSACVYSTCDLNIVQENGTLKIAGTYKNGIHTKKDLTIKKVNLTVTAVADALKGEKSVEISSGTVTLVSSAGDGIQTTDTDVSSKGKQRGTVTISGGAVYIYACNDGIDAAYDAVISGSGTEVYVYTGDYAYGKTGTYAAAGESSKGIKADNEITLTDATVTIKSTDDGLHANAGTTFDSGSVGAGNIVLTNASLTIALAEDDGICADGEVVVNSGTVEADSYDNGISAPSVTIGGGTVTVRSYSGDGIKSSDGNVTITGGTITINAAYDGIQANDSVNISGSETKITAYTSTYSSYTNTSVDTDAYLMLGSVSSSYWYAVYFYNSSSDYVWVTPTYKTYESSYYYYKFKNYTDYTYFKVYRFTSDVTEPSTDAYNAVSAQCSRSGYFTTTYNAVRASVSGSTVSLTKTAYTSDSAKGIKSYNEINVAEATVWIKSKDDCIHANNDNGKGNVTITSGNLTLYTLDQGILADYTATVEGGTIDITYAREGMQAVYLYFKGGTTTVYAVDDGINASKGSTSYTPCIYVYDGATIDISVPSGDTDGIDSNGNYIQYGGKVVTRDATSDTSGNMSAFDIDGTCTITGGTFVCVGTPSSSYPSSSSCCYVKFPCGSSGMGGGPGGGGRPGSSGSSSSSSSAYTFTSGTWYVKNSSGTTLLSFTLATSYKGLWICSDTFSKGNTYTITNGSTSYSWTQSSQATSL